MQIKIKTKDGHKGKSFSAHVLSVAFASGLWEAGKAKSPSHPVVAVLACTPGETVPVREGLRLGYDALLHGIGINEEVSFGRDNGYLISESSRVHGADVFTIYVPDLCDYQPGSIGDLVHFMVMPAKADVEELLRDREAEIEQALDHVRVAIPIRERRESGYAWNFDRDFVGDAAVFVRYLAQRAECPPYPGLAFATQLYASALISSRTPLAVTGSTGTKISENSHYTRHIGFRSYVHPEFQLRPGFAFKATQEQTTAWMIEQLKRYDQAREQIARAPMEVTNGQT